MTMVRLSPAAPWSRVKHSTTEPLRSLLGFLATNLLIGDILEGICVKLFCVLASGSRGYFVERYFYENMMVHCLLWSGSHFVRQNVISCAVLVEDIRGNICVT